MYRLTLAFLLLTSTAWAGALPQHYQVIDLGVDTYVSAIDDDNTVIGSLNWRAARLWPTRAYVDGPPLSSILTAAMAITDGIIVGSRGMPTPRATLWRPDGSRVDLGSLGDGSLTSVAWASSRTLIVGECGAPDAANAVPCFWRLTRGQPGPAQRLPLPPEFWYGQALSVSASGMICGIAWSPSSGGQAMCWVDGRPLDLDPSTSQPAGSAAMGVTRHALVVGTAPFPTTPWDVKHAFSWTRHRGLRDLGTLPGHVHSVLYAVTDEARPLAVGMSVTGWQEADVQTAVRVRLSTQGTGTLEDLNAFTARPDMHLEQATAVNRHGWIGAYTRTSHGVLLIPADVVAKDHADDDDDDDDDDNDE